MKTHTLPVFFAWFRHNLCTPPCQDRAGASLNRRAQRHHMTAHRALALVLTGGVD